MSGINPGFNTGRLVLHSGTVGAVLTAASLDVCAAAFSTEAHSVLGLDTTSRVATSVIGGLVDAGLPPVAVNVNVPALPFQELRGLRFADPGTVSCDDVASTSKAIVSRCAGGGIRRLTTTDRTLTSSPVA